MSVVSAEELAHLKMVSRLKKDKPESTGQKKQRKGKGGAKKSDSSDTPSVMRAMLGGEAVVGTEGTSDTFIWSGAASSNSSSSSSNSRDRIPGVPRATLSTKGMSKVVRPRIDPRDEFKSSQQVLQSSEASAHDADGADNGLGSVDDATADQDPLASVFIKGVIEDMHFMQGKGSKEWTEDDDENMAEHISFIAAMNGHRLVTPTGLPGQGVLPQPPVPSPASPGVGSGTGDRESKMKVDKKEKGRKGRREGNENNDSSSREPASARVSSRGRVALRDGRYATERKPSEKLDILYRRNTNRAVGGTKNELDQERVQRLAKGLAQIYIMNDEKRRKNGSIPSRIHASLTGSSQGLKKKGTVWNPFEFLWPKS